MALSLPYPMMYTCMLGARVYIMMYNFVMNAINFLGYDWFKATFSDHPMAIYAYNLADEDNKSRELLFKFRIFDLFVNRLSKYVDVFNVKLHETDGTRIFKVEFLNNRVYFTRHIYWPYMDLVKRSVNQEKHWSSNGSVSVSVSAKRRAKFLMVSCEGVDITTFFNSIFDSLTMLHNNYSVSEVVEIMRLDGLVPINNKENKPAKINCIMDDVDLTEIEYTDIIVGQ